MASRVTWDGRSESGDITVPFIQEDAIRLVALRMAAAHYERLNDQPNVMGYGAAIAHHLHSTDPKAWEGFKTDAINLIRSLYNSGIRDFGRTGESDGMSYFAALHDLGKTLAV